MDTEPAISRRRNPFRTVFIAVLLLGLISGVWYWSDHQPQAPAESGGKVSGGRNSNGGRAQPVTVEAARTMDIRVWVNALGTVTPRNLVTVRAKVDGTLLKVHFHEGQSVKIGELLAEIDPRPFLIQLDQAKGQLMRDTALLDNAHLDLKRYQDLLARDAIARQQVETQAALVRQYQGSVESDRSQVANAKLQLEYTRVTAPSAGRTGLRQVDPGNQIHMTDANGLVSIAQLQPTTVLFAVPEAHLPAINKRLDQHQTVPVEAWDREQRNRLAEGHLLTTDNQIDPATGTIKIRAEFSNRDHRLFPNQFVNIRVLLNTLSQVVAVPTAAVQRGNKGNFVYRVNAEDTVSMASVTPGAVDGEWVAVSGEIKAGDKIVTDGADKLRDGAKAEIIVPSAQQSKGKAGRRAPDAGSEKSSPEAGPKPHNRRAHAE